MSLIFGRIELMSVGEPVVIFSATAAAAATFLILIKTWVKISLWTQYTRDEHTKICKLQINQIIIVTEPNKKWHKNIRLRTHKRLPQTTKTMHF